MQLQRIPLAVRLWALAALVVATLLWPRPGAASPAGVAVVVAGSASEHTCAVTMAGGLKCWGRNDYGQLGDGSTTNSATPVDVEGLGSSVVAVATGKSHTCALTTAGGVKCWGRNDYGQLGDDRACGIMCVGPVDVVGLEAGVVAVAAGYAHTCVLTTVGGVKCWGNNFHGQLGNGQIGDFRATPVDVAQLTSGVATVAVGDWHSCAVTTAGGAKCWGENLHGQLGDGTFGTNRTTPVNVSGLGGAVGAVAAGEVHSCALTTTGGVKCWGRNDYGQLGDGTSGGIITTPVDVVDLTSDVAGISAGSRHTCAVTTTGGVKCWGKNEYGRLGDGTTTNRATPVDVCQDYNEITQECEYVLSGVAGVSAGAAHTCALTTAGGAKCWGGNGAGQLGDETNENRSSPVDVWWAGDGDSDGDGCRDVAEEGSDAQAGGLRDPRNPWDFYDVAGPGGGPPDQYIDLPNDILGVIARHSSSGGVYDPAFDRGPSTGPNLWNMTAPDATIDLFNDILGVISQYQHDCRT